YKFNTFIAMFLIISEIYLFLFRTHVILSCEQAEELLENRRIERHQKFDETCAPFLAEMKNLSGVNRGSFGNVCVETRFRSLFRIVPKVFILFGKDKDVYKKDEDV
ncbi:hypothetical protein AAH128_19250, partial [Phocaeicola vulgatus]